MTARVRVRVGVEVEVGVGESVFIRGKNKLRPAGLGGGGVEDIAAALS